MDQNASPRESILRHYRKRHKVSDLDCGIGLLPRGHHSQASEPFTQSLRDPTDFELEPIRANAAKHAAFSHPDFANYLRIIQPADSVRLTLGQA